MTKYILLIQYINKISLKQQKRQLIKSERLNPSFNFNMFDRIKLKSQQVLQKIGYDNTAYICWTFASILWNIGFIFPSQHKIGVIGSNLSRGLGLVFLNGIGLYWRQFFTRESSPHKQLNKLELFYVSIRHVLLSLYGYGFAQSQFYLPSPVLYTIYFSGPLFVMILEYVLFKITLTQRQVKGVIFTGIGVLLTANGQLIWAWITNDHSFHTSFKNYKTQSFIVKSFVALILVFLTFGWACAVLLVRQVKGFAHWKLNFNLGYILTSVSGMLYMVYPDKVLTVQPTLFIQCLIKQGLVIASAQAFFMIALLLTKKSGPVCMIGFVSVIFSYFLSVLRYNQSLNLLCVLGSLVALIGIYYTVIK